MLQKNKSNTKIVNIIMDKTYYNNYHCYVAALITCLMISLSTASMNIKTDQAALLAMKSNISDPYNIIAKNWSTVTYPCHWVGVTCSSRHTRVATLNLSNMALSGSIAPEIGNLSFLVSLDLSGNDFHGYLPQEFANLRRLKFMNLAFNKFVGEIPSWFGFLTELQFLKLRNNNFSGSMFPFSLSNMSKLESLDLSVNYLQGKIPEEIGRLPNLRNLLVQYNSLTGSIPSTIFNMSTLEIIAFTKNSLTSNLPANMCSHLPNLNEFYISYNEFGGQIPSTLSQCSKLQKLSLSYNRFVGVIPRTIGKLKNLKILFLGGNNLTGMIPEEIGNLQNLTELAMESNKISDSIPFSIFNISSLITLSFAFNKLNGTIPREIGNLSMLQKLLLGANNLTGIIPEEIANLHQLVELKLSNNNLTGTIPSGIFNISSLRKIEINGNHLSGNLPPGMGYNLPNLQVLWIHSNSLSGTISISISESTNQIPELSFITSLTSCRNLIDLSLSGNPLNGVLPSSIGNLSTSLKRFLAGRCNINGNIPDEIGNLGSLIDLSLADNDLTGIIPTTVHALKDLQRLSLKNNQLTVSIPVEFCDLQKLGLIELNGNQLSGSIPECLGNMTSLRYLYLQNNKLNSTIPSSLWNMKDLLELNLSSNSLTGFWPPEISNLRVATLIDLSMNNFSGIVPTTIGGLQHLAHLSLANNNLQGSIPQSIGSLLSLVYLDLSQNNLSGLIPKSLEALQYLNFLNVSFNHLTGEIPPNGPFKNLTGLSFLSNGALCGPSKFHVPPCSNSTSIHKSKKRKVILIVVFTLVGIAFAMLTSIVVFVLFKSQKNKVPTEMDILPITKQLRVSYYELLQATDGYSENNLLGKGSFGSVFKGLLKNGTTIAVKVFNLEVEGAFKSFDTECEVLRDIRHRNLAKIISTCCNTDFKALVLEYMPNGNLEKWLYSENCFLDIMQRLDIMIDVASALEYLHDNYLLTVIHCDLKPSNILLDENMVAHVSDFGIAKLLGERESIAHTRTLATFGYMAPEYGLDGLVSTKCDVYSFGILLMETFTRRKPSDEIFDGDFTLRTWIKESLPNSLIQIVDAKLLGPENEPITHIPDDNIYLSGELQCVKSIMELALNCSTESPGERINMKDVAITLQNFKHQLLAQCIEI